MIESNIKKLINIMVNKSKGFKLVDGVDTFVLGTSGREISVSQAEKIFKKIIGSKSVIGRPFLSERLRMAKLIDMDLPKNRTKCHLKTWQIFREENFAEKVGTQFVDNLKKKIEEKDVKEKLSIVKNPVYDLSENFSIPEHKEGLINVLFNKVKNYLSKISNLVQTRVTDILSRQGEEVMVTGMLNGEDVFRNKNSDKLKEIKNELSKSNLTKSYTFEREVSQAVENYENRIKTVIPFEDYHQIILFDKLSFNQWLNIIMFDHLELYFIQLMEAVTLKDSNLSIKRHEVFETAGMPNFVHVEVENNLLLVGFNNKCIQIEFINEKWNIHSSLTPGFSVLQKYYDNSVKDKPINLELVELPQKVVDKTFTTDFNKSYDSKLDAVAAFWNMKGTDLKYLIYKHNKNAFIDENGRLFFRNEFNKSLFNVGGTFLTQEEMVEGKTRMVEIYSEDLTCKDWSLQQPPSSKHQYKRLEVHSQLPIKILFLLGNEEQDEFERYLSDALETGVIPKELVELYFMMSYPDKPVYVMDYARQELLDIDLVTDFSITEEHLLNWQELCYDPNYFYAYNNQVKDTIVNGVKIQEKLTLEIFKEHVPMLNAILVKSKTTNISKEEIHFLSLFFGYINKKSYIHSKVKIREIFDIINERKISQKLINHYTDIFLMRLGDLSVLLTCMCVYIDQTSISENALKSIIELQWHRVKTVYWVDYYKKLSSQIKNYRSLCNRSLLYEDFKNLQYIEMMVGQLGSDGKSPVEIVSTRVYSQIEKILVAPELSKKLTLTQIQMANLICKNIMYNYWKAVFKRYKDNRIKNKRTTDLPGIYKTLNERNDFATSASTGGCGSIFNQKEVYIAKGINLEQFDNIQFGQATKSGAFESEKTSFWLRTIFDLPLTICNMVLKPKEFAKQRYIYGVWMPHYLMNTITTYVFEDFLNVYGVNNIVDDLETLKDAHKYRDQNYNCIDYSEFNDQHLEIHKKSIWDGYHLALSETNFVNKEEHLFCSRWIKNSCEQMLIRTVDDPTVMHKHKGRLFSGERATTLTNSLMSIFYHALISLSIVCEKERKNKLSTKIDDIIQIFKEERQEFPRWLIDIFSANKSLGDDSICRVPSIHYAHKYNEYALLCGLILKVEKCLVGVGVSEYLRKIQIRKNLPIYTEKGYLVRSIISLVAGNLEGTLDRRFDTAIKEVYSQLCVVYNRSCKEGILNSLLRAIISKLLKLQRKGSEITGLDKLNVDWAFVSKTKNGLGLTTIGTNLIYDVPFSLEKIEFEGDYLIDKTFDLYATQVQIERTVSEMAEYGDMDERKVQTERRRVMSSLVLTHTGNKVIYTNKFLTHYSKVAKQINQKLQAVGKWISFEQTMSTNPVEIKKCLDFLVRNFSTITTDQTGVAGLNKKIEALKRKLVIINLKVGVTISSIIKKELGGLAYWVYNLGEQEYLPNLLPQHFEIGVFYVLLGIFLLRMEYTGGVHNMAIALKMHIQSTMMIR